MSSPDEASVVVAWLFLALGVIYEAIGFPLWSRMLERDTMSPFAVKTEETLADDLTWFKVNTYAGRIIFTTGFACVCLSFFFFLLDVLPFGTKILLLVLFATVGPALCYVLIRKKLQEVSSEGESGLDI